MSTPDTDPVATKLASDFNLTPPDPVPDVAPEKAAGLVPVDEEKKSKLAVKVDNFVAELVAEDANSPAFGEKVDQITRMGQEQIDAACFRDQVGLQALTGWIFAFCIRDQPLEVFQVPRDRAAEIGIGTHALADLAERR